MLGSKRTARSCLFSGAKGRNCTEVWEHELLIAESNFLSMVSINLKVDVEYKIMSVLGETSFPVPKTYLFCEDKTIMGQEFYVMEYIKV